MRAAASLRTKGCPKTAMSEWYMPIYHSTMPGEATDVLTSAFLAYSAAYVALVFGLRATLAPSRRSFWALAMLSLACLTIFVNAIVPCEPGCGNTTVLGVIHNVVSFPFFLGTLIAMLLLIEPFQRDIRWRAISRTTAAITVASVVGMLALFIVRGTQLPLTGIVQRLDVIGIVAWFLITVNHMRGISSSELD